jgi:hypothetical protein
MHPIQRSLAAAAGGLLLAGSAAAQTSVGVGVEYTTGNFGAPQSTETVYVPFVVKHETGKWIFKGTIPYLRITGPGNVVGAGPDRVVVPGVDNAVTTETGLGDIILSGFYNIKDERSGGLGVDLGAKVKLPTADEQKGLGTGETDYAFQADLFMPLGGATSLFGSIGYRIYGDPPGTTLRNVPYGSIGASHRLSGESSIGVAYDYRPYIINGGSAISEMTAFWSKRMTPEWKVQLYGIVGFSDASPDAGAGLMLERRF